MNAPTKSVAPVTKTDLGGVRASAPLLKVKLGSRQPFLMAFMFRQGVSDAGMVLIVELLSE